VTKSLGDLTWRDHKAALWWLGLLYRRPLRFREALEQLSRWRALRAGLLLLGHALPFVVVIAGLFRWFLFGLLEIPLREPVAAGASALQSHGANLFRGIAGGIATGIVIGISGWIFTAISFALGFRAAGIAAGEAGRIAPGLARGAAYAIPIGIVFGVPFGIAVAINLASVNGTTEIAYGIAGGIIGIPASIMLAIWEKNGTGIAQWIALSVFSLIVPGFVFGGAFGIAVGIVYVIACVIAFLRAYYQPLHVWFVWPALQPRLYRFHPVAWDDLCSLPFPGLHRLLVAYAGISPEAGDAEIERLISSYPSQRMQALHARTTLLAREAGAQQDLARLDAIVARLPEGDKGFLRQTSDIRRLVGEIAAEQRRLDAIDRSVLRQPYAALIVSKVESFHGRVAGFREPLASEFRAAADQWLIIAGRQLAEVQSIAGKEPIPQLFRAGDPVDRSQEAFVARMGVLDQIERQIMLASGCPGLLIYGRRRMGKSTLLRNLDGFLPGSVRIASISMQNPDAFTSIFLLSKLIAMEVAKALGDTASSVATWDEATWDDSSWGDECEEVPTTLAELFRLLAKANDALETENRRLILAFDEFEQFDRKIAQGVFNEDLLATIRESIQMHRRLIWIFAGSHHITELRHAPWDSYLVSVRTIEIPAFSEAETRLLLTEPLRESPIFRNHEAQRPRLDAAFWGDRGIEWIHEQAGGWPHLVQLVAGTAVDLVNEANVQSLDGDMLERGADRSIVDGDTVLRQLMRGESELPGEWDYLIGFRSKDDQPPPHDEAVFQSLRRRQLITEEAGLWRLRVPLMQRWLRQRG
jgi:AAA ATPase domain